MAIILPDLPYAYDALEPYIDAETMTLHHDKHHATYVANANAALEKHPEIGEDLEALLADVEQIPADIRQALINNGGGHLNHALFWELLSPEKQEPTAEVAAAINEAFGSFEAFQEAFTAAATTRFGSGWAWLVSDKDGKLEILLLTLKVSLKSFQQLTKTPLSQTVRNQSWHLMFGNTLTT